MTGRNVLAVLLVSILIPVLAGCGGDGKPGIPQAEPVWDLLRSVRDNDLELFKSVWTEERAKDFEELGWEKGFERWSADIKQDLGDDFDLSDFEFTYADNEVVFKFKDQDGKEKDIDIGVMEVDGVWKIRER